MARVVEADFAELGDALGALGADDFRDVKAATEALSPTLLLYEIGEL